MDLEPYSRSTRRATTTPFSTHSRAMQTVGIPQPGYWHSATHSSAVSVEAGIPISVQCFQSAATALDTLNGRAFPVRMEGRLIPIWFSQGTHSMGRHPQAVISTTAKYSPCRFLL